MKVMMRLYSLGLEILSKCDVISAPKLLLERTVILNVLKIKHSSWSTENSA